MHKNKKLTYILLGVIAVGVLAVSAIFLINHTSSQPEKEPLTTEGLIDQSKRNHQESVAQQLYLTAKLQYIDKGYFPEKLENLTEDIESVKESAMFCAKFSETGISLPSICKVAESSIGCF